MICTVEGCAKAEFCRGWCSMHYTRWRTHGDLFTVGKPGGQKAVLDSERPPCTVRGCRNPSRSKRAAGLCASHRAAAYREKNGQAVRDGIEAWNLGHPKERLAMKRAQQRRAQSESLPHAIRRYEPWESGELRLAADYRRPAREVAETVGRTYAAIHNMRHKIRTDPEVARRIGGPRG